MHDHQHRIREKAQLHKEASDIDIRRTEARNIMFLVRKTNQHSVGQADNNLDTSTQLSAIANQQDNNIKDRLHDYLISCSPVNH